MNNLHKPYGPYEKYFKRPLDFLCGLTAVVVFGWLYIIIAVLVRVNLGAPVLFRQKRPGKDGKIFEIYKFRSMTAAKNDDGELLPDTERLTRFGRFLRTTSLDELPEAFNIIKGEMSVVGPRPLAVQYLPYYNEKELCRHYVRPGLSGLAQINGRNAVNWEEKFAYDIEYVNKITFWGDIKIILLTVKTALKRESIGTRGVDAPIDFDVYRRQQQEAGGVKQ